MPFPTRIDDTPPSVPVAEPEGDKNQPPPYGARIEIEMGVVRNLVVLHLGAIDLTNDFAKEHNIINEPPPKKYSSPIPIPSREPYPVVVPLPPQQAAPVVAPIQVFDG